MRPGGATEIVAQFAGYLQLFEMLVRGRPAYEGDPPPPLPLDSGAFADMADRLTRTDDAELPARIPLPRLEQASLPAIEAAFHHVPRFVGDAFRPIPAATGGSPQAATPDIDGGGTIRFLTELPPDPVYAPGGDESDLRISQINRLDDDDIVVPEGYDIATLAGDAEPAAVVHELLALARDAIEQALGPILQHAGDPVAMIDAFDAARADTDVADGGLANAAAGRHVDGSFMPGATPASDPFVLPGRPESVMNGTIPDGACTIQVIETGGNAALNAVTMVDAQAMRGSLVVCGDYIRTDLIAQFNVYRNSDSLAGGDTAGLSGDIVTNVADFVPRDAGAMAAAGAGALGASWRVDVCDGDFLDLKAVFQTNWIQDNDIVVHGTPIGYVIQTGFNLSGNSAALSDYGKYYDIVIVLGDYREANLIIQANVLADDDRVDAGGGSLDPAIAAGGNQLVNYAAIESLGGSGWNAIDADLAALIRDIADRDGSIDGALADALSGNGDGVTSVLLVTGDYYDINLVAQVNVVADMDLVVRDATEDGASAEGTAAVGTGDNLLANVAVISDVGTLGPQFVGGEVYSESLLVQTDIVVPESSGAGAASPAPLVSEVVAFIAPETEQSPDDAAPAAGPTGAHHDMLGNLLT